VPSESHVFNAFLQEDFGCQDTYGGVKHNVAEQLHQPFHLRHSQPKVSIGIQDIFKIFLVKVFLQIIVAGSDKSHVLVFNAVDGYG